jgi:hypothetical protein
MKSRLTPSQLFQLHRKQHPEVLDLLINLARGIRLSGKRRASIRVIWEQARLRNPELGGLNDHLHSRYARLIMDQAPDLDGMFSTRRLRSD